MKQKTLFDFLDSSIYPNPFDKHKLGGYSLYEVELEVHGYLWFHTVATPTPIGWVHQLAPVIHNYSLILGFLGYPVEESYANPIDKPSYHTVRKRVKEKGFYVYPAIVTKALTRRVQFTGIGEGHVGIRGRTRLTYPERGFNTLLLPGSMLKTYILAGNRFEVPKYIRVGAKRAGILKVTRITSLSYKLGEGYEITHPANAYDAGLEEGSGLVLLKHKGGSVVVFARVEKAIVATKKGQHGNEEQVVLAYPLKLLGES